MASARNLGGNKWQTWVMINWGMFNKETFAVVCSDRGNPGRIVQRTVIGLAWPQLPTQQVMKQEPSAWQHQLRALCTQRKRTACLWTDLEASADLVDRIQPNKHPFSSFLLQTLFQSQLGPGVRNLVMQPISIRLHVHGAGWSTAENMQGQETGHLSYSQHGTKM